MEMPAAGSRPQQHQLTKYICSWPKTEFHNLDKIQTNTDKIQQLHKNTVKYICSWPKTELNFIILTKYSKYIKIQENTSVAGQKRNFIILSKYRQITDKNRKIQTNADKMHLQLLKTEFHILDKIHTNYSTKNTDKIHL